MFKIIKLVELINEKGKNNGLGNIQNAFIYKQEIYSKAKLM
jgi:hypothetical protein